MRVKLRNKYDDEYFVFTYFPTDTMELYDILDKLGVNNQFDNVYMNIDDERIPKVMCEGGFYDDLFKMNVLAQRLDELPPADTAGFTAVLYDHEDYNLDDLILVTYGLDAYPIYPCSSYAELGEMVIDNDMIPEVENCSDELIPYLDKESIGRLAAERLKGTFIGNYYCEVADYEPPDMAITIDKPPRNEFQILVGTTEQKAQWSTLPYTENMKGKFVYDIRSPLPTIKKARDIFDLNELAERVAELDRGDLIKLKAAMEGNGIEEIGGALMIIKFLDNIDFDNSVRSIAEFGAEYLRRQLPDDFDMSVLHSMYLNIVGSKILDNKNGSVTSYGVVSGLGQELYSAITVQSEETEDEELDEDCEEGLGAIQ